MPYNTDLDTSFSHSMPHFDDHGDALMRNDAYILGGIYVEAWFFARTGFSFFLFFWIAVLLQRRIFGTTSSPRNTQPGNPSSSTQFWTFTDIPTENWHWEERNRRVQFCSYCLSRTSKRKGTSNPLPRRTVSFISWLLFWETNVNEQILALSRQR